MDFARVGRGRVFFNPTKPKQLTFKPNSAHDITHMDTIQAINKIIKHVKQWWPTNNPNHPNFQKLGPTRPDPTQPSPSVDGPGPRPTLRFVLRSPFS